MIQDFKGKHILLGICGGVAAYKSAYLARELVRLGAEVQVVMTVSAQEFISPLLMQALTGQAVRVELFDRQAEAAMGHIELARWADYLVVAPLSANCLAKMANGLADDLLSTLYLVVDVPVIVCPAMNKSMWAHPATQTNCQVLRERGLIVVGPELGEQACGEFGYGRLSEVSSIINALHLQAVKGLLVGKKVVITAGPTRERIDPVRYISNDSSGKMGYALAEAACMAGAEVVLVSGPSQLDISSGVSFIAVQSAAAMYEAVMQELNGDAIFIAAAAVADYRLESPALEKIKKQDQEALRLTLLRNKDIVSEVVASNKASFVVGFAAETKDLLQQATDKLHRKKLDMIVANWVGEGLGFDSDQNQVTVITASSQLELPLMSKIALSGELIALIAKITDNTGF